MGIIDDDIARIIMIMNTEYHEIDRIFAMNGILNESYFHRLSEKEQDDIIDRLAIGIEAYNSWIQSKILEDDPRALPLISGIKK